MDWLGILALSVLVVAGAIGLTALFAKAIIILIGPPEEL